jgi:hypothetical protein
MENFFEGLSVSGSKKKKKTLKWALSNKYELGSSGSVDAPLVVFSEQGNELA